MTIHTNMQSHRVTLTLPLKDALSELDATTEEVFDHLVVFIEHSDGTKEIVKGKIVSYKSDSDYGIQFEIDKFSTFTLVYMDDDSQMNLHQPYISGYEDGTFRPDKPVTRAELATMLANILKLSYSNEDKPLPLKDVMTEHWAYSNIGAVVDAGLMVGYPDETFKPESSLTRAEMVTMISRWKDAELAGVQATAQFTDVHDHWAVEDIQRIAGAGWVQGYPGNIFKPDAPITRAEAVVLLNTVLNRGPLNGVERTMWTDVSEQHWAIGHIHEASIIHRYIVTEDGEIIDK